MERYALLPSALAHSLLVRSPFACLCSSSCSRPGQERRPTFEHASTLLSTKNILLTYVTCAIIIDIGYSSPMLIWYLLRNLLPGSAFTTETCSFNRYYTRLLAE